MTQQVPTKLFHRGCLTRKPGAGYLYSDPSQENIDLDFLLIDPPWQPWKNMGVPWNYFMTAQGMTTWTDENGVAHIFDYIGGESYPWFPWLHQEGQQFGFSRQIPVTTDLSGLSSDPNNPSWHFLAHPKGWLANPEVLLNDQQHIKLCPIHNEIHDKPDIGHGIFDMCTGYLWEAMGVAEDGNRRETVAFPLKLPEGAEPSFYMDICKAPKGAKLEWEPAIVMRLTIPEIHLIRDPDNDKALDRWLEKLNKSSVPYQILDY